MKPTTNLFQTPLYNYVLEKFIVAKGSTVELNLPDNLGIDKFDLRFCYGGISAPSLGDFFVFRRDCDKNRVFIDSLISYQDFAQLAKAFTLGVKRVNLNISNVTPGAICFVNSSDTDVILDVFIDKLYTPVSF